MDNEKAKKHFKMVLILGLVFTPIGFILKTNLNMDFSSLGEILSLVGIVFLIYGAIKYFKNGKKEKPNKDLRGQTQTDLKKTINYLNSKMWYRLVKVVYLFLFLVIILVANIIIIEQGIGRLNQNKTIIYCLHGDKRVLTAKQAGVYFSNGDFKNGFDYKKYFEGYNDYDIKDILTACYDKTPNENVHVIQRVYEIIGFKDEPKEYNKNYLDEQIKKISEPFITNTQMASYLDYSIRLFDIKPVYSYNEFIKYFVITNLFILFLFEVLRRIFYYIVLGTIKPKK